MGSTGTYDRALGPRERKRQQRRELLLAAVGVFAARGYAGASVDHVVRQAGMSRKTFYVHFRDLEDALSAVHERSAEFVVRHVEEVLRGVEPGVPRLRVGVAALLGLVAANPGLARVLFWEVRAAGPRFEARQQKVRERLGGLLRVELEALVEAGGAARVPSPLGLWAVVAGMEAAGVHMATTGEPSVEEATEEMVRLALAACAR